MGLGFFKVFKSNKNFHKFYKFNWVIFLSHVTCLFIIIPMFSYYIVIIKSLKPYGIYNYKGFTTGMSINKLRNNCILGKWDVLVGLGYSVPLIKNAVQGQLSVEF